MRINRTNDIKTMKEKREIIALCIFLVVSLAIALAIHFGVKDKEVYVKSGHSGEYYNIGGVKCVPKNNIDTYLFMGVDFRGTAKAAIDSGETHQADVIQLLIIDRANNTYSTLSVDRDTITDVDSLDSNGVYLATTPIQIALAYANGDGGKDSCENTVKAVSEYLYGQQIDGYVAVGMDAISKLNHEVGGVTVTIEDDFSDSDPSLKMGETIKLNDEQAWHYVHDRMNVGDGSNEARMRRHSMYLNNLKKIVEEKTATKKKYPINLYHSLDDYTISSLSGHDLSKISKAILKNKNTGSYKIKGTSTVDDYGFNAFTYDKKSRDDTVIELFYDKVKETKKTK